MGINNVEITKDLADDLKEYLYQQISLWEGISERDKNQAKDLLERLQSELSV